jgi:hypothetical protein
MPDPTLDLAMLGARDETPIPPLAPEGNSSLKLLWHA